MNDHPVRVEEARKLAAELRAPSWNKEDHDPKAIYRTRPIALFERAAEMIECLAAPHPIEAQGSETELERVAVVPREPTERDVAEILYEINRKRSREDSLSEAQVREFVSTFLYVCARYPATDALTRPDPSLGGEPEDRPHDPSKLQAEAEELLQRLQDAWDYDATMGDACDMGADWCRAAEHRWKRAKRALEIIRSTDRAALSPPSLGMEGVREIVGDDIERLTRAFDDACHPQPRTSQLRYEWSVYDQSKAVENHPQRLSSLRWRNWRVNAMRQALAILEDGND